jgi:hypothetical protein
MNKVLFKYRFSREIEVDSYFVHGECGVGLVGFVSALYRSMHLDLSSYPLSGKQRNDRSTSLTCSCIRDVHDILTPNIERRKRHSAIFER